MRRFFILATIISGILFSTGCTSIKTVVIDVQKPAQLTLPKYVNNIGIVNNAVPQPYSWGHTKSEYTKKGEKVASELSVPNDSVNIILIETLFDGLVDLNYFDNVSLYEFPIRTDLAFKEESPVDSATIREICQITNSDAIISLDRFLVNTVSREEPYDFDTNIEYLDLQMEARFRIYSKNGTMISPPFYLGDSIFWAAARNTKGKLISEDSIPDRESAIKEAAVYAAEKISKSFAPSWTSVPRVYYGDNKEASKKADANDWLGAINLWENSFNNETKPKKKARLANNIALGYELSDNLKESLKWAMISTQLFTETAENSIDQKYLEMATYYQNELSERYEDFRILDMRENRSE